MLTVADSKTEAGEGRTIPLNSALFGVMVEYATSLQFARVPANAVHGRFAIPRNCGVTRYDCDSSSLQWRSPRTVSALAHS
jgi:hypothetical protein